MQCTQLFTLVSDDPKLAEELKNKNSTLENNLQSVYVKSKGDVSTYIIVIINTVYLTFF